MNQVFKAENLQEDIIRDGYVIINEFINKEELSTLRNKYLSTPNDLGKGFHATTHSKIVAYRKEITKSISDVVTPKVDYLLDGYKPIVGTFTVKEVGPESFFDFHLDWNMVDERHSISVTVWIALEDTNERNGNLWILDKSVHLGSTYRCSPGLLMFIENKKNLLSHKFKKICLPMKAGDAIIYDHRLIHGSPSNFGHLPRLAINMVYISSKVSPVHYVYEANKLKLYKNSSF